MLQFQLLQELAEEFQIDSNDGQVFISTQSPGFLNAVPLESIYGLVKKDDFTTTRKAMDMLRGNVQDASAAFEKSRSQQS